MLSVTWPVARAWRLGRQLLEPVGPASVPEVIGALGAVAAQLDPSAAELGISARRRTFAPGDVRRALEAGEVVRTFAFRGAVHLMTPDRAGVHLALRAASRMWERRSWQDYYALTPGDWPVLRAAVRAALLNGPMTRTELASAVAVGPRFGHLVPAFTDPSWTFVKPFAWLGDLSIGASRDGEATVHGLAANPRWTGLPAVDVAGRGAIETYLRAYGPASVDNLQYWLGEGLGVRRALLRDWLTALGERLATVAVDGEPRLVLRDDVDDLAGARPTSAVRLLPKYDQWVLGPGTADTRVVPASLRADVSRGANVVVAGGFVTGTWRLDGDAITVALGPDGPGASEEDLDAEIERLAELLDRPVHRSTVGRG